MRGLETAAGGYLRLSDHQLKRIVSNEPIQKFFLVEEEPFARGKYAAVKRCRELSSGREFAAKSLKKKGKESSREEILHEVAVLEACRACKQIVTLHKVFESNSDIVLVLELARGGELQTILDSDDDLPSEKHVQELMRQIIDGIVFLHNINVAHLDIKPQNVILMNEFPNCEAKLCDFGISRYLSQGADVREILGTPDYVAPEVLNYEPISLATDMWSVGVLLYVLLSGCSPFGGDTKQETFCNISQCRLDFPDDLFSDISEEAKDLITKLVVKSPSGRLSAEQCKNHPWFTKSFSEPSTISPINGLVPSMPSPKPRTPVPLKRSAVSEEKSMPEVISNSTPEDKIISKITQEKNLLNTCDNINNNVIQISRGLSEERRKSFKSNLKSLVERLDNDETVKGSRIQRTDSLKRASGMQTMPAIRYQNINTDLETTVYKFQRVVVVDEDEGLPPSLASSSVDNSSISDSSSISEMSIDSGSDRSSIISLDDSLDYNCGGKLRHYSSCLNVWDPHRHHTDRTLPKECNESFARAMSKFRSGENEQPIKVRLRSSEDRSRFHLFNSNRLSLPQPPPGRKTIGLEFVRERNGNLVVIREVKAIQGKKYSRTSELKCETVQSRIRKLQQIRSDQLGNSVF